MAYHGFVPRARTYGSIPDHDTVTLIDHGEESLATSHKEESSKPTKIPILILGCCLLVAGLALVAMTANRTDAEKQEEDELVPPLSLEASLDQWDQFKSKLGDWLTSREQDAQTLGSLLHEDTDELWNATSHQLTETWEATSDSREGLWNATANGAKHGWAATGARTAAIWNATRDGAKHAGGATEKTAENIWNKTAAFSGHAESETSEKTAELWNMTASATGHASKATVDEAEELWNSTSSFSGHAESEAAEEASELWNSTVFASMHAEKATMNEAKVIWNKTVHFSEHAEGATVAEADKIWNKTVHGVEHTGVTAEDWLVHETDEAKVLWNETALVTGDWIHTEDQAIKAWWNQTDYSAKSWWQDRLDWWKNMTTHTTPTPPLQYLNSTYAYSLLTNGVGKWFDYSQDYFRYQQGWDTQINQAYCAVATSVALLNSLREEEGISLPQDPTYDPHPFATQASVFNGCTEKNVIVNNGTYNGIVQSPGGLSMSQTTALLECWLPGTWTVTAHHVDPLTFSIDDVRADLQQALKNPDARVVINYDRSSVNQLGGGHWSPLGSYSSDLDAFLVMDVAKYKYPAVWIPLATLYKSISTYDTCGDWNFPSAQLNLRMKYRHPTTELDYTTSMKHLGCTATRRGYIIVEKK